MDADHSLSGAPCPPSLRDQTRTNSDHPRRFAGEDRETELLAMKVRSPRLLPEQLRSGV